MIHLRYVYLEDVSRDIWEVDTLRTFCSVNMFNAVHYVAYIPKVYIHLWKVMVAIINKGKLWRNTDLFAFIFLL